MLFLCVSVFVFFLYLGFAFRGFFSLRVLCFKCFFVSCVLFISCSFLAGVGFGDFFVLLATFGVSWCFLIVLTFLKAFSKKHVLTKHSKRKNTGGK